MKKFVFSFILLSCLILPFSLLSCGGGGGGDNDPIEPSQDIIPTNIQFNVSIVGQDSTNPNGDGSGIVQCSVFATNAVSYAFRFGNGPLIESTTGTMEHTFTTGGTTNQIIYAFAYSSTGHNISTSKTITIYFNDEEQPIWSDEFDYSGAPDSSKWSYDIGNGSNGWGNGELQYYTDREENVIVEDGKLKITAKKENYQGFQYTSTRMLTMDKFEFTYGKIEIRAKLPAGGGTWPAFWMLGANFTTVGWPTCGEIDIMEHVGNDVGTVQSAIHTPSSSGNTVNKGATYYEDVTNEFHIYSAEWTSEKIDFALDGTIFYTYNPTTKNSSTWPFNNDQFIILNIAMGGVLGGEIDPQFTSTTMEIDYVRVYQ